MRRDHCRHQMVLRRLVVPITVVVALAVSAADAGADAAVPTVTGPVAGTPVITTTTFDLGVVGYEQAEFFLSGTATAYAPVAPLTPDGQWDIAPVAGSEQPYTTRIVVYRPTDPERFSGTVHVEWLNVSGLLDAAPDWNYMHNEMIREGHAWVGVSAQLVGVTDTKAKDPVRYESLSHPGDSYSFDMFSQAGQAIWADPATLGGTAAQHVIAIGESQSASRLVTYVNAVHPLVDVYDGFFIHSRSGPGAPLSQDPLPAVVPPTGTEVRDDLGVPAIVFQAETDVFNSQLLAREPDTPMFRLWEVAGSAHADTYNLGIGNTDIGDGQGAIAQFQSMITPPSTVAGGFIQCDLPINAGPAHWVLQAALHHLTRWVADGTPPPIAPRLQVASTNPVVFATDAQGNVLGGIRTPHVDAPIATLSGLGQPNPPTSPTGGFCRLFGTTDPFTKQELDTLYRTHGRFVAAWNRATNAAVKAGFLLRSDAQDLRRAATQSDVVR
jgi:hypothetical protein